MRQFPYPAVTASIRGLIAVLTTSSALLLAAASLAAPASATTEVHTSLGVVRGTETQGVRAFKGIPFAIPPVGALRFEPPRPARPWHGVLEGRDYRSACPQPARFGVTDASDDEDCLYLNVTVPASHASTAAKLPVIFWIHGGAYVGGSSNLYPLEYYARTGNVVVVSINYRLGVFGFLSHPALDPAHDGGLGLEDQREALRWVKRNIAAFGGDPDNVTLAGESAGAASVCFQLMVPAQTKGLFHKAIIQSIACGVHLETAADANRTGLEVAKRLHCDDPAKALACLRAKSVAEVLDVQTAVAASIPRAFSPSIGSVSVPGQGAAAFAAGRFLHVPMINGGTRDEMRLYVAYAMQAGQVVNAETYPKLLAGMYGDKAADIAAEYPPAQYPAVPSALGTVQSDFAPGAPLANCSYLETAADVARYTTVYEFEFADRHAPPEMDDPGFELGAVHSSELPYFFPHISHNSKVNGPDLEPSSQEISDAMVAYWSSFARTGSPAAPGLPAWPKFTGPGDTMRFEPGEMHTFDASAAHHCGFWAARYPELLPRLH